MRHLSKRQSRILTAVILFCFFALGIFSWKSHERSLGSDPTSPQEHSPEPQASPSSATPDQTRSSFSLNNFRRSETRDGKLLWEVSGDSAEFVQKQNAVKIENCTLIFFTKAGDRLDLHSEHAKVWLGEGDLARAKVYGKVHLVINDETTILTERAIYSAKKNSISAPGKVIIRGDWFEVRGIELQGDVIHRTFTLSRQVESELHPEKRSKL